LEGLGGLAQSGFLSAGDGHAGTVLQEGSSDSQADAAAAPGHQSGFVG